MTKAVATNVLSEDDREMFVVVCLDNKEELHVSIDKKKGNHHVYVWKESNRGKVMES